MLPVGTGRHGQIMAAKITVEDADLYGAGSVIRNWLRIRQHDKGQTPDVARLYRAHRRVMHENSGRIDTRSRTYVIETILGGQMGRKEGLHQ